MLKPETVNNDWHCFGAKAAIPMDRKVMMLIMHLAVNCMMRQTKERGHATNLVTDSSQSVA